jgi:hypothetical protein
MGKQQSMNYTPFTTLIRDAMQMLNDRSKSEINLIIAICKLTEEERASILFAWSLMQDEDK